MNRLLAAALVATLLAAAVPTAQAQAPTGITLACEDLAAPIPYAGTAALACTVSVGCLEILSSGGSMEATITVESPPAWLTTSPTAVAIDGTACFTGAGTTAATSNVPLSVSKDAPGVVETPLSLVATIGSTASPPDAAIISVEYNWNYTVTADLTFPYTMTTPSVTFNLTVTQASNARSMVMMEETRTSAGTISGLTSTVYENEAGKPDTKVFKVTYTAPTGEWENATVDFMAYGHYLLLDSSSGDYDEGKHVVFDFVNGGVKPEGDGGGKESPAPVGALLAIGLLALAFVARRRQ